MNGRATVVGYGMWKRLGLAFVLMATGLAASFLGLGGDFYQHEVVGLKAGDESLLSPVHLLIFGGILLTGLGFLLGALALRREGHTPLRMATS